MQIQSRQQQKKTIMPSADKPTENQNKGCSCGQECPHDSYDLADPNTSFNILISAYGNMKLGGDELINHPKTVVANESPDAPVYNIKEAKKYMDFLEVVIKTLGLKEQEILKKENSTKEDDEERKELATLRLIMELDYLEHAEAFRSELTKKDVNVVHIMAASLKIHKLKESVKWYRKIYGVPKSVDITFIPNGDSVSTEFKIAYKTE